MRRRPAKFLAVALALAALPLLALAQAPAEPAKPPEPPKPSLFSVYATLNANTQYTSAKGATNPAQDVKGRAAVSFDSSNIGIKGSLLVTEYAGATYQCETSANADGINPSGICNRNSRVGITGNWGTLFYGNWDTPLKAAAYGTKADDPFMNTDVYGFNSIMGSPGFNYRTSNYVTGAATPIFGFDVRAQDSVGYHSPKFYGVSVKLQYSVNEFMNASATQDPSLYGAVLNWDYGPFSILASYESHRDGYALVGITAAAPGAFGATLPNTAGTATNSIHSSDTAWRAGAGYQLDSPIGATTLGVLVDELTLKQDEAPTDPANPTLGAVKQYKRLAWQVALKHRAGDHEIRARYSMANDGTATLAGGGGSATDYGASMLALGYAYYFAPSLQVYLHYAQIRNKDNAQYTFIIGGASAAAGVPAVAGGTPKGADPMAIGLGVRYTFGT